MTNYSLGALGISEFHWWYASIKTQGSSPGFYSAAVVIEIWSDFKQDKITVSRYTEPKYSTWSLCCYTPLPIKLNAVKCARL
jgi:hypothetical protein